MTKSTEITPSTLIRIRQHLLDVRAYANATTRQELSDYRRDTYQAKCDGKVAFGNSKVQAFHDEVESRFPGIFVMHNGGNVPYQAEGFIGEYAFYLRSRHGYAELRVFPVFDHTLTEQQLLKQGYRGFFYGLDSQGQTDEGYRSKVDVEEYWNGKDLDIWENLIDALEPSQFIYRFHTVKPDWDSYKLIDENGPEDAQWNWEFTLGRHNEHAERLQWAHSSEEAYRKLCSSEHNPHYWKIDRVHADPVPFTKDERVFPDPLPDFSTISRTPLF